MSLPSAETWGDDPKRARGPGLECRGRVRHDHETPPRAGCPHSVRASLRPKLHGENLSNWAKLCCGGAPSGQVATCYWRVAGKRASGLAESGSIVHFIGVGREVVETRAVQRRPKEERWNKELAQSLLATPWCKPVPPEDHRVLEALPLVKSLCRGRRRKGRTRARPQTGVHPRR